MYEKPIFDFHTHPYLDNTDSICRYTSHMPSGSEVFPKDLSACGITRFAGSVITRASGTTPDLPHLHECNELALRLRDMYKGAYVPGIHVTPLDIDGSRKELKWAKENGVILVGELVPYMHGWREYDCEAFSEVLDAVGGYGMTVSLHTIDLDRMDKMAGAHKNVRFVFAHPGEQKDVEKHIAVMKAHDNVYLDLSGTGIFRWGMLRYLIDEVGKERILFGSDYPICNPFCYVGGVLGEPLTNEEREYVFFRNAERVLGL